MLISINAGINIDILISIYDKTLIKLGVGGKFLKLIKGVYKNQGYQLNDKTLNAFP